MFDIGWQELFVVAAITIIIVGPRDLPRVLKTVMGYIRKAKSMARDFQNGVDDVVREVELDDLRKEANSIATMDIDEEIKKTVDPTGSLERNLDMTDVEETIQQTAKDVNESTDEAVPNESALGKSAPGKSAPGKSARVIPELSESSPVPSPSSKEASS